MVTIEAVIGASALLLFFLAVGPLPSFPTPVTIPWPLLAVAFACAEWWRVYIYFRRSAHSLSLSELPLVLGIFLASPQGLVLARFVGGVFAMGVLRRQASLKLGFNVGLFTLETSLAVVLAHALIPLDAAEGHRAWLVVFVIIAALSATGAAMVMLAISVSEGKPAFDQAIRGFLLGIIGGVATSSIALEAVAIVHRDLTELYLLAVPLLTTAIAYAAYAGERQKHQRLSHLYKSKDLLQPAAGAKDAMSSLLAELCSVFHAEMAELIILPEVESDPATVLTARAGQRARSVQLVDPGALDAAIERLEEQGDHAVLRLTQGTIGDVAVLDGRGLKDAMVTLLSAEGATIGLLVVANRLGDLATFGADDARLLETIGAQASISLENWRLDERLKQQAFHDGLTGLANRALFTERLEHALKRRREESRQTLAVLFIDLDDFKMVNDSLGHEVGDLVLRAVAERLNAALREYDTAARLGGDEFAVLLEDLVNPSEAVATAERIVGALKTPLTLESHELTMHASIGVALASPGVSASVLVHEADVAMYRAKDRGKATYELYAPSMQRAAEHRLQLKTDLEHALEAGQLTLHYQPIVALRTGRLVGVEALVRWPHPEGGYVPPIEFIPLAEETGLIMSLGRFVFEEACRQSCEWSRAFPQRPLEMSVNVSPRQLYQPGFAGEVARTLSRTDVAPSRIHLEITESFMVDSSEETRARLDDLRRLGVGLSIDDFGTGYSSLAALHDLPVDTLKLAKEFVDGVADDPRRRAFAKGIVGLGRTLGLRLIAEGVETASQRDQLRDMRCELAQGYYFAKPLPASGITAELRRRASIDARLDGESNIIALPA